MILLKRRILSIAHAGVNLTGSPLCVEALYMYKTTKALKFRMLKDDPQEVQQIALNALKKSSA